MKYAIEKKTQILCNRQLNTGYVHLLAVWYSPNSFYLIPPRAKVRVICRLGSPPQQFFISIINRRTEKEDMCKQGINYINVRTLANTTRER
jgi:hypothetical protein